MKKKEKKWHGLIRHKILQNKKETEIQKNSQDSRFSPDIQTLQNYKYGIINTF